MISSRSHLYIVVYDSGGFGLTTFDKEHAVKFAKNTKGALIELPVIKDFRESNGQEEVE